MYDEKPKVKGKPKPDAPYQTRRLLLITNIAAFMLVVLSADQWLGAVWLRGGISLIFSFLTFIGAIFFLIDAIFNLIPLRWIGHSIITLLLVPCGCIALFISFFMGIPFFPHMVSGDFYVIGFFVTICLYVIEWFYPHTINVLLTKALSVTIPIILILYSLGNFWVQSDATFIADTERYNGHVYLLQIYEGPGGGEGDYSDGIKLYRCNRLWIRCNKIWGLPEYIDSYFSWTAAMQFIESDGDVVVQVEAIQRFRWKNPGRPDPLDVIDVTFPLPSE